MGSNSGSRELRRSVTESIPPENQKTGRILKGCQSFETAIRSLPGSVRFGSWLSGGVALRFAQRLNSRLPIFHASGMSRFTDVPERSPKLRALPNHSASYCSPDTAADSDARRQEEKREQHPKKSWHASRPWREPNASYSPPATATRFRRYCPAASIASTFARRRQWRSSPENFALTNACTSSRASSRPMMRAPRQSTFILSCSTAWWAE